MASKMVALAKLGGDGVERHELSELRVVAELRRGDAGASDGPRRRLKGPGGGRSPPATFGGDSKARG